MVELVDLAERRRELEPVAEVVAVLEELLQRARTGALREIAIATVTADAGVGDGWKPGAPPSDQLMSSITDLHYRCARARHRGIDDDPWSEA